MPSRIFEFAMTQSFSGQMDGTSRSGMGLKPPKPGSFGFWDPQLQKLRPKRHLAFQLVARSLAPAVPARCQLSSTGHWGAGRGEGGVFQLEIAFSVLRDERGGLYRRRPRGGGTTGGWRGGAGLSPLCVSWVPFFLSACASFCVVEPPSSQAALLLLQP